MNINEISEEIKKLEAAETSWSNIQKLAWLYSVYDHMSDGRTPVIANAVQSVMPAYTGEFGKTISGRQIDGVVAVLIEHMSIVKILHPKEYQAVLDKISEIP